MAIRAPDGANNDSLQALLLCLASFINGQVKDVLGILFTLIDNSLSCLNLLDWTSFRVQIFKTPFFLPDIL